MKAPATVALIALALMLPLSSSAQADPRQSPTVDFTADVIISFIVEGKRQEVTTTIWSTKDKTRTQLTIEGRSMFWIYDGRAKKKIMLAPIQKFYAEAPLDEDLNRFAAGAWEITKSGEEAVANVMATKWSVSGKDRNGREWKGLVWTTKENIQVKTEIDGQSGSKTGIELKNLKIGPLGAELFETPLDYTPMPKQ